MRNLQGRLGIELSPARPVYGIIWRVAHQSLEQDVGEWEPCEDSEASRACGGVLLTKLHDRDCCGVCGRGCCFDLLDPQLQDHHSAACANDDGQCRTFDHSDEETVLTGFAQPDRARIAEVEHTGVMRDAGVHELPVH